MRYAFRVLRKNPGFTLAAAITLALGIGANTAIFSVLNAMLLRAMPFRDPQRLAMVWEANPALDSLVAERVQTCLQNFLEWRGQNRVFDGFTGGAKPEQVRAAPVSPGFFDVLGVSGLLGRTFTAQESEPGKSRVVVLSNSLFERRFGGNPKIVGQTIVMNGANYTVVGVLPRHDLASRRYGGIQAGSLGACGYRSQAQGAKPHRPPAVRVRAAQTGRADRAGGRGYDPDCQAPGRKVSATGPHLAHDRLSALRGRHGRGHAPHLAGAGMRGGLRAADRLRQRDQPAAYTRRRAREGDGRSGGAGRGPLADGAAYAG